LNNIRLTMMVALIKMDFDGKSKQFMVYTIEGYSGYMQVRLP